MCGITLNKKKTERVNVESQQKLRETKKEGERVKRPESMISVVNMNREGSHREVKDTTEGFGDHFRANIKSYRC